MGGHTVDLPGGRIRYRDSGKGSPVVLVHGVFVNSSVWRKLESPLVEQGFRVVAPDLPLGAHQLPMGRASEVSPQAVAALLGQLLDVLDLREVTLVGTDTGGALVQLLLASGDQGRVARVVLTACDSFDNFLPPSIRILQYAAQIPGLLRLGAQPLRSARIRALVYRTLAKHGVPDGVAEEWVRPLLTNKGVRRDIAGFLVAIDRRDTLAAADSLRGFPKPVALVWPRRAPYFPFAHAQRWTQILPHARIVDPGDSYTFVSEDQPELLVSVIADHAATT